MANPLDYNINSIVKGVNGFGRKPPASGSTFSITLAGATVMGTINAANTSSFLAIFGYAAATEFWVSVNGTAAVPVGANFAASTSELLPGAYVVKAGDVIQAISTAGGDMSVSFYAIPDA
jgi:hypothetical protein